MARTLIMYKRMRGRKRITLTGTSGTANIVLDGTNYLLTFNTDLSTTANNFVTTHSSNILTNEGITVTNIGVQLEFFKKESDYTIAVVNISGDLSGEL